MKTLLTTILMLTLLTIDLQGQVKNEDENKLKDKTIFVSGGAFDQIYIKYIAGLTGKLNPKICYVPTANGDSPSAIARWYSNCEDLPIRPYVLRTFINSTTSPKAFEEIIMGMDAIVVSGGNTLNMLAIWKAHGIDALLRKAYDKAIILAGGSAGSLCWFTGGSTDSRPKELTIVEGLNFLNFSHSPHYLKESSRRPLYQQLILSGKLKSGYACDDMAGLLFVNGTMRKSVTMNADNNNYFVSVKEAKIIEELLPSEIIK
ncbi:Type 1 glutamine amidotransferase-like domain-containing protein [Flavobacterium sp. XS2P39]|uniref:Type 1 glutamine amidotransferase-like domain-containing protein n=1 Tax=Flavobacterium sp. XS2P39 TaxID=3401725 RepID=UPI003AAB6449